MGIVSEAKRLMRLLDGLQDSVYRELPEVWCPFLLFLAATQGFVPSAVLHPGAVPGLRL